MTSEFELDALEHALYNRQPEPDTQVHHSDRGSQYLSICCTARLAEGGIAPSVLSKEDSNDNALAETINGLYKTEVLRQKGPMKDLNSVEVATQAWVSWFDEYSLSRTAV